MDIKPYCFICRGCPGSGKSFLAKQFAAAFNAVICSADDFFLARGNGVYKFDPNLLGAAHRTCQKKFIDTLYELTNVIVDNTNVKAADYKFYLDVASKHGYKVYFVEPDTAWAMDINECFVKNTHGVPMEALQRMHDSLSHTRTLPTDIESIHSVEEVE